MTGGGEAAAVRDIHHVQITIPPGSEAEAEARRFYGDLLGLREVAKPAALAGRGGLWFEIGTRQLHLGVEAEDHRTPSRAHVAWEVRDLPAWRDRLEAAGAVPIESVPIPGARRFETRDPFGNRIEFIEAVAGS